jgi:hypothetical protein
MQHLNQLKIIYLNNNIKNIFIYLHKLYYLIFFNSFIAILIFEIYYYFITRS